MVVAEVRYLRCTAHAMLHMYPTTQYANPAWSYARPCNECSKETEHTLCNNIVNEDGYAM
jgi:hypothetical protein